MTQFKKTALLILALALATAPATASAARKAKPNATDVAAEKLARGKYLVTVAGCNDCHTPFRAGPKGPEPDMSRMLSGHPESIVLPPPPRLPADSPWSVAVAGTSTAYAGPWGISYTANLTPDKETGLGKWTLRNFIDTIRTGRHLGRGREILPPMPIPMYKHFTDADLEAIYTYLQSIPAIPNRVPDPVPAQ